jgi:hypothetical protein
VTGLATGLGLAITIIAIPLLTLVLASVRPLLAAERGLANSLLDAEIPSASLAPHGEGWFGRLKAYWADGPTWRASRTCSGASRSACSRSPWRSASTRPRCF